MQAGQDLPAMESYLSVPGSSKSIPVKKSDSFTASSLTTLSEILHKMFDPVLEHIQNLGIS